MADTKQRSECPISMALEAWGDKWTLLIIRDLMFENKRTYSDFLNSREGIATNILASRLNRLLDNGIIVSKKPSGDASGKGYALTQKGIDLLPMMLEIYFWMEKYYPIPEDVRSILNTVKADRQAFMQSVANGLATEAGI